MSQPAQPPSVVLPDLGRPSGPALFSPAGAVSSRTISWLSTWIVLLSLSAVAASLVIVGTRIAPGRGFIPVLAAVVCLLAALFDAWTSRIPNPLTYTAIVLGLALNLIAWLLAARHFSTPAAWLAAPGLTQSLLGFGACAIIALLGLCFKVGGGDLKLLAAIGAMLGLYQLLNVLLVALAAAVIYSLLNLIVMGGLNRFVRILSIHILELLYLGRFGKFDADDKPMPARMVPLGVPLAIALVLSQIVDLRGLIGGPGGAA